MSRHDHLDDVDYSSNTTDEDNYLPPAPDSFNGDESQSASAILSNRYSFHEKKWDRHKGHYNDQYLDVFKHTYETDDPQNLALEVPPTQLGAVFWEAAEKTKLYDAVGRKGRHDLKALSRFVRTKSELEVKAYLNFLRQEETDRQMFEAQPKNISHADIPAAIEIGPSCEALLDKAAEALSAFQEQFDIAAGERKSKSWLINPAIAMELDKSADESETNTDDSPTVKIGDEDPQGYAEKTRLYHLSTFLELSERFYMNQGSGDTWHDLAAPGEQPAMTMDLLEDMHDLVVNYVRRLIQSILFVVKSRIRSSTSSFYKPSRVVKHEDVLTALDILNVDINLWDYWRQMPRRNELLVVHKNFVKRFDPDTVLSYDEVEKALLNRTRRRSQSTMSEELVQNEDSSTEPTDEENGASYNAHSDEAADSDADEDVIPTTETRTHHSGDEGDVVSSSDDDHDNVNAAHSSDSPVPLSKRKRVEMLEANTNDYMETIDQRARQHEESRLFQLLNVDFDKVIKEEDVYDIHRRPKEVRKSISETKGWSAVYQSQWEIERELMVQPSFTDKTPEVKRRKVDYS